jgi:hypothetical protein
VFVIAADFNMIESFEYFAAHGRCSGTVLRQGYEICSESQRDSSPETFFKVIAYVQEMRMKGGFPAIYYDPAELSISEQIEKIIDILYFQSVRVVVKHAERAIVYA